MDSGDSVKLYGTLWNCMGLDGTPYSEGDAASCRGNTVPAQTSGSARVHPVDGEGRVGCDQGGAERGRAQRWWLLRRAKQTVDPG